MIKMIKPIVNISKVIEPYNTVIVGFNGVLSEGNGVKSEAVEALIQMKRAGRHIVLLSNTALRVSSLINGLHEIKEFLPDLTISLRKTFPVRILFIWTPPPNKAT